MNTRDLDIITVYARESSMVNLNLNVNGKDYIVKAEANASLLSILREELHLTGAKPGCGEGQCGACTVLVSGHAVHSCMTAAADVGSRPVLTIEGLAHGAKLHPVQQAFLDQSAFQCGYCTPGMIMASVGLLNKNSHPTVQEIRTELNGNVCRCGTYGRIIKAVRQASQDTTHA